MSVCKGFLASAPYYGVGGLIGIFHTKDQPLYLGITLLAVNNSTGNVVLTWWEVVKFISADEVFSKLIP